jgi:transglutaminase-like putative cysteine protease
MRLSIRHEARYSYDGEVPYALQRVRLHPTDDRLQTVANWSLEIEGANEEVRFLDHFGNDTRLLSVSGSPGEVVVVASGEVDTHDLSGVLGPHSGFAPLWLFQQPTSLTQPEELVRDIAGSRLPDVIALKDLHALSGRIRDRVEYVVGSTDPTTTAEQALARGQGVCQDHAHVFVAAARNLGAPARYVSGYLMLDGATEQVASHAWAEVHVEGLGWVGFDISNGISPDERYVRLACGRDYRDAMPSSGIRLGQATERLAVHITVEQ